MANQIKVTDLKEANVFLNSNERLEESTKTLVAMFNGNLERVWVKYKNTLQSSTEAVLSVSLKDKKYTFIKKYRAIASRNAVISDFVNILEEAGFTDSQLRSSSTAELIQPSDMN